MRNVLLVVNDENRRAAHDTRRWQSGGDGGGNPFEAQRPGLRHEARRQRAQRRGKLEHRRAVTQHDVAHDARVGRAAVARRDKGPKEKEFLPADTLLAEVPKILTEIQQSLLERALAFRKEHTRKIDSKEEFYAFFTPKNPNKPEIHGGFALTHWNGSAEVEAKIKEELKVTIRCIPEVDGVEFTDEPGICPFSGEPSKQRVIFGKAY